MKPILLLICSLALTMSVCQTLTAQQLPTPPNTIPLRDSLFIDETELANVHWQEFLFYIRKDSSQEFYYSMHPDTLVWAQRTLPKPSMSNVELSTRYFRSPEYQFYPVAGISYEQAQAYARWRSAVVSQVLNKHENLVKLGLVGMRIEVQYRLPTEKEWCWEV